MTPGSRFQERANADEPKDNAAQDAPVIMMIMCHDKIVPKCHDACKTPQRLCCPGEYGQGREAAWRCGAHSWEASAAGAFVFKAATFLSTGTTLILMLEDWSSSSIPTREGQPGFRRNFDKECLHYTLELSHPEERDHILSVVLHDTGAQPSRLRSPEVKSQDFPIQPRHLCYAAKQSRYLTKRFRIKEEPALQRTGSTSFDIANTIYARLLTVKELN